MSELFEEQTDTAHMCQLEELDGQNETPKDLPQQNNQQGYAPQLKSREIIGKMH